MNRNDRKGVNAVKLDGMGLMVQDMATMVRFYRDVLGFEIVWRKRGDR